MSTQDNIDALLPDNTSGDITPAVMRQAYSEITTEPDSAIAKAAETLTGFDRENSDTGGKSLGIIQYCHLASSGEIHQIAEDDTGEYTLLTGQTVFADGTALADRTLSQYHAAGDTQFSYWRHGVLVEVAEAKRIQLAVGFEGYVGYNASGELDDTITDIRELIVRTPLVAYLYLNGTTGELVWYADERHGIVEDPQTHLMKHQDGGFFVAAGVRVSGILNNGTTLTGVSSGGAGDEDIKMFYSATTTVPKMYKEGANGEWRISNDDDKLGMFVGGDATYNLDTGGTWSLEPLGSDYVIMTGLATNNKLHPVVAVVGQTLHPTRSSARDHAPQEWHRMDDEGMPTQEVERINSYILQGNTGKIETGADGEVYVYYVKRNVVPFHA